LGNDHLDTAQSLNSLGILYRNKGNYEQAELLYQCALAIYEQKLGEEHPNTARSLNNLAVLYRNKGNYEQAEPLYQRALAIRERTLGGEHPLTLKTRKDYDELRMRIKEGVDGGEGGLGRRVGGVWMGGPDAC